MKFVRWLSTRTLPLALCLIFLLFGAIGTVLSLKQPEVPKVAPKAPTTSVLTKKEEPKPVVAGESTTTQPAPAQPSPPATSSASTTTPSKPVNSTPPTKPYTPPTPAALLITSVELRANTTSCPYGYPITTFAYSFVFNYPNAGGSVNSRWEYEVPPGETPPLPPALNFSVASGTTQYFDSTIVEGFRQYIWYGYRVRLHATSPTDRYSAWIDIPQTTNNYCASP